jgi:tRNA threonylcarbamoyladenosine biosynthesis protein TsaE
LGVKKIYTLLEVDQIAREIIELISGKVVLFYGQMGVGKTTLIKEICKSLHTEDIISSPTFSLVNEYRTQNDAPIYHFDFYRIDSEEEALDIGVEDYFYSGDWCLIEWPNNIQNLLPLDAVEIHLSHAADGKRSIQLIQN